MEAANLNADALFTITCPEKHGPIDRSVYKMPLSRESLLEFWKRARKYSNLFTREINDNFNTFVSLFIEEKGDGSIEGKGLLYRVDDYVGIFYMTEIDSPNDALVHFTFLDGRIRGRDELAKGMLKYVFQTYGFRRVSAHVPMYVVPAALEFVERVGFKKEGRKRKCVMHKGEWFDMMQFGILSTEVQ